MKMRSVSTIALRPTGMRAKLTWAFLLMSCVPLLVLLLVAALFVFPYTRELFPALSAYFLDPGADPLMTTWWIGSMIGITVIIASLGNAYLSIKVTDPILKISQEAKRIAEQPAGAPELESRDDELGELTDAINQMTTRLRENMIELQQVGERTTQINREIHSRMVILSSLLQIGELISNSTDLETVLDVVVERLAAVEEHAFSFLCLQPTEGLPVTLRRGSQLDVKRLSQIAFVSSSVIIDFEHPPTEAARPLWEEIGMPNLIIQPVVIRTRLVGILALGNRKPRMVFSPEVFDLLSVFVKQVAIALENEILVRRAKALSPRDELTGVYNETYIRQRINEEIKRAASCRRPCAVVLFSLDGMASFRTARGELEAERALKKIAGVLQENVTEIDRVGRTGGHEFVVVLPERNKRAALELATEMHRRAENILAPDGQGEAMLTLFGGVAENPLDGTNGDELLLKARQAAAGAMRSSGRPVVAV